MSVNRKHINDLKILFKTLKQDFSDPNKHDFIVQSSSNPRSLSRKKRKALDNIFQKINGKITMIEYEKSQLDKSRKSRSTARANSARSKKPKRSQTLKIHSV